MWSAPGSCTSATTRGASWPHLGRCHARRSQREQDAHVVELFHTGRGVAHRLDREAVTEIETLVEVQLHRQGVRRVRVPGCAPWSSRPLSGTDAMATWRHPVPDTVTTVPTGPLAAHPTATSPAATTTPPMLRQTGRITPPFYRRLQGGPAPMCPIGPNRTTTRDSAGQRHFASPTGTFAAYRNGQYRGVLLDDTYFGVNSAKFFITVRVNTAGKDRRSAHGRQHQPVRVGTSLREDVRVVMAVEDPRPCRPGPGGDPMEPKVTSDARPQSSPPSERRPGGRG